MLTLALGLAALTTSGSARAESSTEFQAALVRRSEGDAAGAVAAFERLTATAPADDPWVDDALLEAAELREEVLGDPVVALALYRRILSEHPDGHPARKAQVRAAALGAALGPNGAWATAVIEMTAILRLPRERTLEGISRMRDLLVAYPKMPRAGDAQLWVAEAWLREGYFAEALTEYRRVATLPEVALAWQGRKGAADILLITGELDDADRAFATLAKEADASGDVAHSLAAAKGRYDVALARGRLRSARLAWLAVFGFFAFTLASLRRSSGSWRAAGRALARPPVETLYLAPVALVISLAASTGNELAARAVYLILGGGVAASWLSGAAADAARRRVGRLSGPLALAHVFALAAVVVAICYLAVTRDQLVDLIRETWLRGHDR